MLTVRRLVHIRLPRGDPSRTSAVVRAYQADLARRWKELNRVLRLMIVRDDILGLSDSPPRVVLQLRPPGRFTFPADVAGKSDAFARWLAGALDSELLEISPATGTGSGWQNKYVRASYSKGVTHAEATLRAQGIDPPPGAIAQTLNQPIHVEKLQLLFSRNFNELKGVTEAVSQSLSRIVTEGLATGASPLDVAREITRSIRSIGVVRGRAIARTEILRAHSTATLTRFRQSGIQAVQGFAEFSTAGDNRVCQTCQDLEGKRFTLDEAASIIPVHVNCRCVWLPVVDADAPSFRTPEFFDR